MKTLISQSSIEPRFTSLNKSTPVGFEPTRGDPIGLAGRRLSHSAKVSLAIGSPILNSRPIAISCFPPLPRARGTEESPDGTLAAATDLQSSRTLAIDASCDHPSPSRQPRSPKGQTGRRWACPGADKQTKRASARLITMSDSSEEEL